MTKNDELNPRARRTLTFKPEADRRVKVIASQGRAKARDMLRGFPGFSVREALAETQEFVS